MNMHIDSAEARTDFFFPSLQQLNRTIANDRIEHWLEDAWEGTARHCWATNVVSMPDFPIMDFEGLES